MPLVLFANLERGTFWLWSLGRLGVKGCQRCLDASRSSDFLCQQFTIQVAAAKSWSPGEMMSFELCYWHSLHISPPTFTAITIISLSSHLWEDLTTFSYDYGLISWFMIEKWQIYIPAKQVVLTEWHSWCHCFWPLPRFDPVPPKPMYLFLWVSF